MRVGLLGAESGLQDGPEFQGSRNWMLPMNRGVAEPRLSGLEPKSTSETCNLLWN
jgi:hypothetical protein